MGISSNACLFVCFFKFYFSSQCLLAFCTDDDVKFKPQVGKKSLGRTGGREGGNR